MFFSKQRMRSRADTRYSERSRSLLRVFRQAQVSYVSPVPALAPLYRRRRFNLQRVPQEIHSARRFLRLQGPARHSWTARYRRRSPPEFGVLHSLQRRRNPTHSPGGRRRTHVSYLRCELEFIFTLQESGTWITLTKISFLFYYILNVVCIFYVFRTIPWYVTAEISFFRESIQGDEQTTAAFRTRPEIWLTSQNMTRKNC